MTELLRVYCIWNVKVGTAPGGGHSTESRPSPTYALIIADYGERRWEEEDLEVRHCFPEYSAFKGKAPTQHRPNQTCRPNNLSQHS